MESWTLLWKAHAGDARGGYRYPPVLWPGSVVDNLYDLAEELAGQFDWPGKDAAAWFVLTGKAPEVRPIDARWELKQGGYLNPQWRIRLTIPPFVPEQEVMRAYRRLRKQLRGGTRLPKTSTPLEVARFVWERERLQGYKKKTWASLLEEWNEKHPEARFKTYNNFRTYFARGDKAVKELNFDWPQPDEKDPLNGTLDALKKALRDDPRLRKMSVEEALMEVPTQELARRLVAGGYLEQEPSPPLLESALRSIDAESPALEADEAEGTGI